MADDTIPQDDPRPLTEDERVALACDWSDYRKDYGVNGDERIRMLEHRAFKHAWQVARVGTIEQTAKIADALDREGGQSYDCDMKHPDDVAKAIRALKETS